jgi:DNA modification methylase
MHRERPLLRNRAMARTPSTNTLFYGDNLDIMRECIAEESVDLVYLDPPFNSNATYNVLFRAPGGEGSQAQIEAFGDTWHWNRSAEDAFDRVIKSDNSDAAEVLRAMRSFLKENDMMAYLAMMAVRLLELHRVLKPTGSLYLHCDPTASHYLKSLLDAVFGKEQILNEIIWKRTFAHGSAKRYGPIHDTILFYSKNADFVWTYPRLEHDPSYIEKHFRNFDEAKKDRFQAISLTGAGVRHGESGNPWRGVNPTNVGRHWALPKNVLDREGILGGTVQERLDELDANGRIYWPKSEDGTPRLKWFVSDLDGVSMSDIWTDIPPISAQAKERLGYPTQKPLALLERIIAASSNEGDLVLDPFCGCGTTVHAAQKLNRRWIGIDITHLAISLIKRRLIDAFPQAQFEIHGVPKDIGAARELAAQDKHQFQLWALSMIEAQPYKDGKKGGDTGIDGYLYFKPDGKTTEKAIVSVKGGQNLNPNMVRDLVGTVEAENAKLGIFLTLEDPTTGMRLAATRSGFYETEYGKFEKMQILTVEELFEGKRPHMPWIDPSVFKKAKRENTERQEKLDI